jgi:hypothetical protein
MQLQDFVNFNDLYFQTYEGWGEAPATVWDMQTDEIMTVPEVIAEGDDPYKLMDEFAVFGVTREAILAVRGWAAPIDDEGQDNDTRPSLHPKKMRIVMYLHLKNGSDTLTVAVSQEGKDLMVMDEAGVGAMADAIAEAVANVKDRLIKIKEGV